jgi:hypothetical protein
MVGDERLIVVDERLIVADERLIVIDERLIVAGSVGFHSCTCRKPVPVGKGMVIPVGINIGIRHKAILP